ncbi:MAG: response regulator [Negativicutes bacterium]|nr:response regulator [Negativicutes bacterium]
MEKVLNVVIIEDDPMVLELHRQYVGKMPEYRLAGCAASGEEGLQLVHDLKPQLAIVDIYMPGINGLQLLKNIRSSGLNTDVILVTAAHDTDSIQQGIQYGATDYIIKPFTYQRLRKSLLNYLRYYDKLHSNHRFSQKEVDMLKAGSNKEEEAYNNDLPKGLQQSTLDLILKALKEKDGYFSILEVSDGLGISRVTVRRYVNYLKEIGWLKEMLSYGPVGRPSQKFMFSQDLRERKSI